MKPNLSSCLVLFITVTVAACTTVTSVLGDTTIPTVTIMATVSTTGKPIANPTATPNPAPTSIQQPTVEYRQTCITIEDSLPANLRPGGALLLNEGWNTSMYHLDLMSKRKSPFPAYPLYPSLSPDGKWLAYLEVVNNEQGQRKDLLLRVANAEGRNLDMSYWGLNWQYLIGWKDEKHLLLAVPGYPGGDYIILNPFTMQKEVIKAEIPGINT